jgi:carbonic anhydrase
MEPIFAEKVKAGALKVVGAKYSLETGTVEWMS